MRDDNHEPSAYDSGTPFQDAIATVLGAIDGAAYHGTDPGVYYPKGLEEEHGVRVCRRELPFPHWHYVTCGLAELHRPRSDDNATGSIRFELSFRLRARIDDEDAPMWASQLLHKVAYMIIITGRAIDHYPVFWLKGPIGPDPRTELCALATCKDAQLQPIATARGELHFMQLVCITADEFEALSRWNTSAFLDVIMPHIPMGIVDITRETFLRDGTIQTQVADGTLRDGCSTGVVADSSLSLLALRQRKFWLFFRHTEVLLSVAEFHEIQSIIPLRLPYGRTFEFSRAETVLLFEPAAKNAFSLSGSKLTIGLNADGLKCLTEDVPTSDGVHVFIHVFAALPLLRWFVHNYPLKNPDDTIATV